MSTRKEFKIKKSVIKKMEIDYITLLKKLEVKLNKFILQLSFCKFLKEFL